MPKLKIGWEQELPSLYSRINKKTQKNHSNCLIWTGAISGKKYPAIRFQGNLWTIHRLLMTIKYGKINEGHEVDHECFNILCVNVDHLRVVPIEINRKLKDPRKRGHKGGVSGEWGIYYNHKGKWQVNIKKEGRNNTTGKVYDNLSEAVIARDKLFENLFPNGLKTEIEAELDG